MRWLALLLSCWGVRVWAGEALPQASMSIHSRGVVHRLLAEVADTEARRRRGLMEREELPEGRGMLFVYPRLQSPSGGFWMYRTRIPLDLAFLAQDGRILAIRSMDPCTSPDPHDCPVHRAGVAYQAALEIRQDWFAEHGIQVGDVVRLGPVLGR